MPESPIKTPPHGDYRRATYKRMEELLTHALGDLSILAGDTIGPSNVTWRDIAGTCAVNLQCLTWQIEAARQGNHEPFITFPSPAECLERSAESHEASKLVAVIVKSPEVGKQVDFALRIRGIAHTVVAETINVSTEHVITVQQLIKEYSR